MVTFLFLVFIFISCILQGITGFGFALLAAPLILLFYDQQTTVVVLTIVSLVLNFFLIQRIKSGIKIRIVKKLVMFGLIGVFAGVLALLAIDQNILKLITGILAFIFSLALFASKNRFRVKNSLTIFIGLLTGFLQSSIGISGPPLVLLLTGYRLGIKEMRKTLAIVFFFLSVFCLPLFLWKNILTWDRFLLGILSIPLIFLGGNIGNWISNHVSKHLFRILSLILILVVSLQIIFNVFIGWKIL